MPFGVVFWFGRPARTPSERSRARSLDDLSKSCQQSRQSGDPTQHHHHHHHHHPQQLGSDNGLDKIDWETPFDPVVGWHSLAGQSSSPSRKLTARLDYDEDGTTSQEEEEMEVSLSRRSGVMVYIDIHRGAGEAGKAGGKRETVFD